ncbi:MAG: hypothetical protein C0497_11100 [Gemmatimonas sp.]|nr:hypothetical protein [Gemmatimonas sp.]
MRATVHAEADSTTAWHIAVEGLEGVGIERVLYPRLGGIGLTEMAELSVPLWMGQRAKDPRNLLSGPDGKGRRFEWGYPGQLSFQMIALTRGATAGLYVATDDSLAYRKSFIMSGDQEGYGRIEIAHQLADPAKATRYEPTYAVKLGVVHGTWMHAAERYRAWGERQAWARNSRVARGTATPWLRETGVWVWNRGRASTEAVKKAHAADVRAIVYMNQRLWCVQTPSWKHENAERYAVRERDGKVRLETYMVFDPSPCAPMDIATKFWRDKYAGIADTVVQQYGIDGIYMDQAVLSLACWSSDHGHPMGGGHYWMDGFRALASDLRRRNGASLGLAGEGGGESWLPDLDAFLTLQVSQERYSDPSSGWDPLPMFQAVYHHHAITYGTYGSLTYPPYDELWPDSTRPANALTLLDPKYRRHFLMEQARMFVWGMQPTIANLRLSSSPSARGRSRTSYG